MVSPVSESESVLGETRCRAIFSFSTTQHSTTAPRPKRARTNTVSKKVDELMQEDYMSKLKPHETLWHEDGNVVLATDVFLYRVHKGVLANQSTFFKDMFQLPNIGGGGENGAVDDWNGVPLVTMVGDKDEDVYNFLMTLYDRK